MKNRLITLFFCIFALLGFLPTIVFADGPIEDGVYYISNTKYDGYLGLGAYHNVDPYIYYVIGAEDRTADGYWVITNTESGYTFRNEATGELLVYTTERVDQYYKYMKLADESLGDGSEFWNIIEGSDGAYCIQSAIDTNYYWNLRSGTYMMGTYRGGDGNGWNERYVFHKKEDGPGPDPGTDPDPLTQTDEYTQVVFPKALHVYLSNRRIEAYPLNYVTGHSEQDGRLVIETNIGKDYTYDLAEVDSVSEYAPADFPTFETFKFNSKYNDQVFTTANGELVEDTVYVTIAAIGKRLTPSFTLTDEDAEVYAGGKLQTSKESRLRFDKDIYYVVAPAGCTMLLPSSDTKGISYTMQPYGRCVRVQVDWLTDRAEVPTIYINTADGQSITSKTIFKDATITIDGHGIFPSMEETAMQIKGRGNSSWGWAKKPYRLKFAEKVKPLGMTKGKNWVLLANGIGGSLMSNAVGMKAANLMEASAANHIVPVDLYLNGEYRGSYNLTEKVGFSNNSVDLDDESAAAMLELDSYYDEPEGQKFRSMPYNLPINIKEPEFAEGTTTLTLEVIQNSFNAFMTALKKEQDISPFVDLEQLARFLMVNELICNFELYHPKSTFCYRESFDADTSKYVFGPVWDLDWGFGYEQNRSYFKDNTTSNFWINMPNFEVKQFIQDLRWNSEPLCVIYEQLWKKFMDEDLQELLEYAQDYYDFAHNSFDSNRDKWGDRTNYAQQAKDAANWLETRANRIYEDILNGVRPEKIEPVEPIEFANDKLYTIECRRGELVLSYDYKGLEAGQSAWWTVQDYEKQFAIINIEGNNYLYSPYLKKYLRTGTASNGEWVSQLGSPLYFDTSNADGEYVFMISTLTENGNTYWFNNNTSTIVINSWNTPDDGDRWMIAEVGDFDPTEAIELAQADLLAVTINVMYDGEVVASETKKLPYGADMPEPSSSLNNAFVTLKPIGTHPYMVTGETTIAYEAQWIGPFDFTTSLGDAKWYNMTIRTNYMVGKTETEPYFPIIVDDIETLAMPTFQWAFGGNPYKIKVYNRSTGLSETLTPDNGCAVMRPGIYEWDLLPNSDGFVLRMPGTEQTCINQFGGETGPLMFWDDPRSLYNDGSTFRLTEAPGLFVYTEFDESTGTLTYYYDAQSLERTGVTELYDPINAPDAVRFKNYYKKVTKVVIDSSMKKAPLTSFRNMSYGGFDSETGAMYLLQNVTSIEGLENLNTEIVTDMNSMFILNSSLTELDLSSFNTSKVTNMNGMFMGCGKLQTLDLTSFDVSNVTDMRMMFGSCFDLTTIYCNDDWSQIVPANNVLENGMDNMAVMFSGCKKLVGGKGTTFDSSNINGTYARPDYGTSAPGYFTFAPVNAPADMATEFYAFRGYDLDYDNYVSGEVQVGFYGENTVYIQGLSQYVPEGWVKGKLEAGTVTIPKTYLGIYTVSDGGWSEDREIFFSGAVFTYNPETGNLYSEGGYVSYETPDDKYFYDQFKYVWLTKYEDVAATPAMPCVLNFSYLDNPYPYVMLYIPTDNAIDGSPIIWSKLAYQIYYCKNGEEKPLVLTTDLYPELEEDMSEIPYKFSQQSIVFNNYLYLRQPVQEIDSWQKVGIQSIYYGGGERRTSEIAWRDNETADGIASTLKDTEEGTAVYNLSGQRVGRNFKGIIIKDGRKILK